MVGDSPPQTTGSVPGWGQSPGGVSRRHKCARTGLGGSLLPPATPNLLGACGDSPSPDRLGVGNLSLGMGSVTVTNDGRSVGIHARPRAATTLHSATVKHMEQIGIRALKQNASAVVARAAAGEALIITDNGRPVAQIMPLPTDRLSALDQAGLLRTAAATAAGIGPPVEHGGPALGDTLREMRDEDHR